MAWNNNYQGQGQQQQYNQGQGQGQGQGQRKFSKNYVGNGYIRNNVVKVSMKIEKIIELIEAQQKLGRKNIVVYVAPLRQEGRYGETHSVYELIVNDYFQAPQAPQAPQNYQQGHPQGQNPQFNHRPSTRPSASPAPPLQQGIQNEFGFENGGSTGFSGGWGGAESDF